MSSKIKCLCNYCGFTVVHDSPDTIRYKMSGHIREFHHNLLMENNLLIVSFTSKLDHEIRELNMNGIKVKIMFVRKNTSSPGDNFSTKNSYGNSLEDLCFAARVLKN